MLSLKIEGRVEAQRKFKKLAKNCPVKMQKISKEAGRWTLRRLRERTPQDTGATRRAWFIRYIKPSNIGFKIQNNRKTIAWLEYGTFPFQKPGAYRIILPRRKKVLFFYIDGRPIFAKKVKHPGTKPLGLVKRTADEADRRVKEIYVTVVKQQILEVSN